MMDVKEATKVVDRNARTLLLKAQIFERLVAYADGGHGGVGLESLSKHAAELSDQLKKSLMTNILIEEEFESTAPKLFDACLNRCVELLTVLNLHQTSATAAREALRKYGEKERQNSQNSGAERQNSGNSTVVNEIDEFLKKAGRR